MIIVTGGAGFIGSNLVKGLNDLGADDILIVDDMTDGNKSRNLNPLRFNDLVDKDEFIADPGRFTDGKADMVFHQGACTDTMEYNGKFMLKNNYEYSRDILSLCIKKGMRMIYASSASVYGNGGRGFAESLLNEDPLNVYAFSKYLFDQRVREVFRSGTHPQIAGLRYFNVYGQQENHKGRMASTAYHFYHQLQSEGKAKLFEGSDTFLRDFVYVDDVVRVNLFFYENPGISGIFNCGTGRAESFSAIAESLIKYMGGGTVETVPFPEKLKGKYQAYTKADLTALRKAGYDRDFMTVDLGVKKYYEYLSGSEGFIPASKRS